MGYSKNSFISKVGGDEKMFTTVKRRRLVPGSITTAAAGWSGSAVVVVASSNACCCLGVGCYGRKLRGSQNHSHWVAAPAVEPTIVVRKSQARK
jgi:hypothetical protein